MLPFSVVVDGSLSDTFTGTPLASLTLAQKLIELRIDHFERLSLSQSLPRNLAVFGWLGTLRALVRRARLGREGVARRIDSLDAQVRDGIAAIEKDPEYGRDSHYRGHGSVSQLHDTLRAFDADDPEELALLRVLLDEHRRELAIELATIEKNPTASASRAPAPPWYDSAAARVIVPLALAVFPFVVALVTWRVLLTRARPEALVLADAEIESPAERSLTKSTHAAVRAAAALHDVAALCNRATNIALGHRGTIADLRSTHDRLVVRVREARAAVVAAREELRPVLVASGAIDTGASAIDNAWSISVTRNTRQVERCTDERDSSGITRRRCRTETVCDSKDTFFSFSLAAMERGLLRFDEALRGVRPEVFDAEALLELSFTLRARSDRTALSRAQLDAMESAPVAALAHAHRALRPLVASDSAPSGLEWIRSSYTNGRDFPQSTSVNTRCSATARGPRGYNAVREFSDPIHRANGGLATLEGNYVIATSTLQTLEAEALALAARSSTRRTTVGLDDAHIALSDRSNELYREFHGDSALVFASRLGRSGYTMLAWFVTAMLSCVLYLVLHGRRSRLAWRASARHANQHAP